ncbi:hypothetical protein [Actinoplanes solisilvae]|uniref:hypothetical protein n=1 Tax=Actinoplanes solisilvae TaxID=2486853 RepID=UPI000FDA8E95|nr:hypothetical protein [Actinoplanes solisilvae]
MRRSQALVVAAVAVTALAGCGSAQGQEQAGGDAKVATLQSHAATTKAPATSKAAQRPRERLDTTPAEFMALLGPYNKCLKDQGVNMTTAKLPSDKSGQPGAAAEPGRPRPATPEDEAKLDAANKICEPQYYPLPPWEKDPANPEAKDFAVGVVKCLKTKGVEYVEVSDDGISIALGGEKNDPRSIKLGLDHVSECERKVAAEAK